MIINLKKDEVKNLNGNKKFKWLIKNIMVNKMSIVNLIQIL